MSAAQPVRILAISGSLRATSSNTELLRAAAGIAPEGVSVVLYGGLGDLPHFNPDLEGSESDLPAVADLRTRVREADGLLISSPEYAHGVPGVLKDALDWLVGSGELVGKPVVVLDTSARSAHAHASLVETLTVMSARVTTFAVPLDGKRLDEAGMLADPEVSRALRAALSGLVEPMR